jgi:hypothetical protein
VNSWASLYAGAPLQFTTGWIGCSGLCSLINSLIVGTVGFKFRYFHLDSMFRHDLVRPDFSNACEM